MKKLGKVDLSRALFFTAVTCLAVVMVVCIEVRRDAGTESVSSDPEEFAFLLGDLMPGYRLEPTSRNGFASGFYLTNRPKGYNLDGNLNPYDAEAWKGTLRFTPELPGQVVAFSDDTGPWKIGNYEVTGDSDMAAEVWRALNRRN